ncbi:hypothetical protein AVEN_36773-1 [Araneus ventricosus]|uniref:Uncharacterized protein n=1 Tax=Araneus ventricosus TaxID=182803 RepID=A0A4Y2NPD9_ARAVE|nr:hypothetical protein AVEN_36773-1 [Araneus ventricosus]
MESIKIHAKYIERNWVVYTCLSPSLGIGQVFFFFSNPSDLNQIRSMRSFAFIISNRKYGRLSKLSYTKATQSSRCCGVAPIMLHFVQIFNFLSPRENPGFFKSPEAKRAKAVWSFLFPLKHIAAPGPSLRYHE